LSIFIYFFILSKLITVTVSYFWRQQRSIDCRGDTVSEAEVTK